MHEGAIEGFRLSPQQRRVWRLQELKSAPAYAAQAAAFVEGALKPELLQQAIEQTINRHEILRTTFRLLAEMEIPLQVIGDCGLVWRAKQHPVKGDLRELQADVESLLEAERQPPFDAKSGGVFRASLFDLTEGRSLLLITLPALCADLLTLKNLLAEIGNEYEALVRGRPYAIEPMQYADISEWENELLAAEDSSPGREYWRGRREDAQAARSFKLPYEKRDAAATTSRHMSSFQTTLPASVTNLIAETAQAHGCSMQAIMLASWQALLWKLSGAELIETGTAFDGRQYTELETALGLLVRHLPISSHIKPRLSFAELARQLDAQMNEARKWQEYFFVEDDDAAPLDEAQQTRVGFEYLAWPPAFTAADISIMALMLSSISESFELKLLCFRREDSILLELQYDGASFDAETIARLAANLQALIERALEEPSAFIRSLEMLSTDERRLLIEELNETTSAALPPSGFVHQAFEQEAASAASGVAAVYRDEQLSYGELNARANQLAHYLRARGVGPDVLVGVCLERSFEMLVAVLGILKAGGAYLPLDSSYPKERLAFIIEDARASLLITTRKQSAMLPQTIRTLLIDAERELIGAYGSANPRSALEPENMAYVIYTSGSTGQPKGVMIPHGGLSNYLSWCAQSYGVAGGQGSPVHSPLTFDLTLTSIFPALLAGKKLLLLDEAEAAGEALARALCEHKDFSLVKLTPAHLEWLAHSLKPDEASGSTRALIIGGEALYAESLRFWRAHSPSTRIINEYGPTEAVVGCCVYEVPPGEPPSGAVPIGRAIANTQLYVLDEELRPTSLMVAGEIYIGGAGLARGYLNRPELTAEKFIPNPFSREAGRRLYRTGDRGRVRADGIIEYLGRTDYQLKIKGYRIEPGEIEAVLCGHADVREAVVIARGEQAEKQLVGYVTARSGAELNESELRGYLRERVPEYMMPSFLVVLDNLPLTANGKVDREALPPPEQRTRPEGRQLVAPRNRSEEILAAIWAELLGVERVGIDDNFFELGGDSIRGIQAIARANRAGIKLAAQQLFEHQTIAGLARVAGSAPVVRTEQHLLAGTVELTPIQRWFFARHSDAPQDFNQSILLEARRPLDLSLLEESARLLLAHHDSLRLRFKQTPSGWQQSYAAADDAPPVSQVLVSAATEAEYAAAIEMAVAEWPPFDLSVGPLLRFTLFRSTSGLPDRLHMMIHHLAVDGVSWRILLEDLELCLAQLAQGESVRLPAKTTSYQYWAEKLTDYAQSETLRQESAYWISEAASSDGRLSFDFAREADNSVARPAQTVSAFLDAEETGALLTNVSQSYRVQINDLLLTALAHALARHVRADSLLICMESHGRQSIFGDVDITRTTGWFTALFPFRLMLSGSTDIGEQLKATKEQLRRVPNHGVGYGLLRYLSRDERIAAQLESLPQPGVLFNYLGNFDQVLPASSLLSLRPESRSSDRRLTSAPDFPLEINASVLDRQLFSDWTYDSTLFRRATVEALAEGFNESLRLLIEHCRKSETSAFTPSDFPKSGLNQTELDQLLSKLRAARGETA